MEYFLNYASVTELSITELIS